MPFRVNQDWHDWQNRQDRQDRKMHHADVSSFSR